MLNRCEFIGNLGNDPEVRNLPSGGKVVNLSIAVTEKWRDRNSGEQKERTEWVRCVIFAEGLAKVAEQYLRKGSKVYIAGQMQTRKWQDQSGQDKYSTEIVLQNFGGQMVLLDSAGSSGGQREPAYAGAGEDAVYGKSGGPAFSPGGMDDDFPFAPEFR